MLDYRENMSKRECLVHAIIWSVLPFLWLVTAVLQLEDGYWYGFIVVAIHVLASVIHWCRYLRYDRKKKGRAADENG